MSPPAKPKADDWLTPAVSIHVACVSCRKTFEATLHAGLVRCRPCQDAHAIFIPGTGAERTVVL